MINVIYVIIYKLYYLILTCQFRYNNDLKVSRKDIYEKLDHNKTYIQRL